MSLTLFNFIFFGYMVMTLYDSNVNKSKDCVGMIVRHNYTNPSNASIDILNKNINAPVSLPEFGQYEKNRMILFSIRFRV